MGKHGGNWFEEKGKRVAGWSALPSASPTSPPRVDPPVANGHRGMREWAWLMRVVDGFVVMLVTGVQNVSMHTVV
jgi:hypothetical protein